MPEFTLRPLTPQDAEPTAALIRHAFAHLSAPIDPPPSALRETAATITALLEKGGGAGAFTGEILIGALLWQEKDGGLYAGRLSVAPTHRGQGIARTLLAAAETEARRRALPVLRLSTRLTLTDNRKLFAACGFVETALHAHEGYSEPTYVDLEKLLINLA